MAVSPILASAILNQRAPDIVGQFRQGAEVGRQERARTLAGQALQGQQGALAELQGLDPQIALQIGESIRANSAADIDETIRDVRMAGALLAGGDTTNAEAFLTDRLQRLQSQGRDTTQTEDVLNKVRTAPNEAFAGIQKFLNVLDGAKQAEGFTLSPGQVRFGPGGEPIASVEGAPPEDKEAAAIRKEVRSSVGQQLKGVNEAASNIRTNMAKVENLAKQIDKGNRSAVPAAVVALVKLGDPGSVVSQAEIETALNKQNPLAALAATLRGKGVNDEVITSLEQRLDPLDPFSVKTPELLATANALVSANIPAIVQNYQSAREQATANLTERGVSSLFTSGLDRKITELQGLLEAPTAPASGQDAQAAPAPGAVLRFDAQGNPI